MLSIFLGTIIFAYTIAYVFNKIKPILRFTKSDKAGDIQVICGIVCDKLESENKAIRGELVDISFPKYEYEVDGEKRFFQGAIRHKNVQKGQAVNIGYCERTREVWAITDIPLMKRDLIYRAAIMIALLVLLALTEILL